MKSYKICKGDSRNDDSMIIRNRETGTEIAEYRTDNYDAEARRALQEGERMKYEVSQTFETLGIPCETVHGSQAAADQAAAELRRELAEMIGDWSVDDDDNDGFLQADERATWARAGEISTTAKYGRAAGAYVAEQAVEIEEIED